MARKSNTETVHAATAADNMTLVEKVARATRIRGIGVETRQASKRPVIVITDDAGTRILAYVDPIHRGDNAGGYRVEVADYGAYRRVMAPDVQSAAAAVKTSARRTPKAPAKSAKSDAKSTPAKSAKSTGRKSAAKSKGKGAAKSAPKSKLSAAQKRAVDHDVAMMANAGINPDAMPTGDNTKDAA